MELSKKVIDAHGLLAEFRAKHPNNVEDLPLTPETIARLQWHLKQELRKGDFIKIEYKENETARQIADSRRFETWEQIPPYMRVNYLRLADCFPGLQLAAVGSRVNGEYLERWSSPDIRKMRADLMKSDKEESDYDYIVSAYLGGNLPADLLDEKKSNIETIGFNFKTDHVRHFLPTEHKILIPMWDFSKLPDDKKKEARELVAVQKWGLLMKMHNDYQLSENSYCCDEKPIVHWFRWAIENDKI